MNRIIQICAVALLLVAEARGQEPSRIPDLGTEDSIRSVHLNSASIALERNLNTFSWVGRMLIDTTAWGTIVRLNDQNTSNVILLDGSSSLTRKLKSNQQNLSLLLGRRLAHNLTSEIQWTSLIYSDNKSVGLGAATFHSALGGVEYYPDDAVSVTPLVGYRWDNQVGIRDRGISYTLAGQTHGIDLDGYQLTGDAQFHEDRLNPRVLQRHFAHLGALKFFSENSRDSLDVGYSRNQREFYGVIDGNIESRIENALSFSNLLDYELDSHLLTSLMVNVFSRSLDKNLRHFSTIRDTLRFNTAIDEFRLDTYVQTTYRSEDGSTVASVRVGHGERNEQHRATAVFNAVNPEFLLNDQDNKESQKNNLTRSTSLSGELQLPLSSSDKFFFSASTSILRYDTPSIDNNDDRDELLIAISMGTTHHINRYLDLRININGALSHVVYLFSEQSGNNNRNRVLRLAPSATYRPTKHIISANTFEVLANYTVNDFGEQISSVQSFSYRQFGWLDSSSIQMNRRIGLDFFGYLKLYERGQLKWSDFSERLENSFVDKTISSQIRFSPEEGLMFALGLRYFSQSRYAYAGGSRSLDTYIRSIGPTCLISWDIAHYSRVTFKGWYEYRTFRGSQELAQESHQSLPNLSMNINLTL